MLRDLVVGFTPLTNINHYLYLIMKVDSLQKYKGGEKIKISFEGLEGWGM